MGAKHQDTSPLCPSAQPGMDGAVIFGVVGGTAQEPRVAHLAQPLPVTDELLALTTPASPTTVYRIAAPCAGDACAHFAQHRCRLVSRIVDELPEAVDGLPACRLRPACRWWQQEGKAACLRCPLVVTEMVNPSETLRRAADPTIYAGEEALGGAVSAAAGGAAPSPQETVRSTLPHDRVQRRAMGDRGGR